MIKQELSAIVRAAANRNLEERDYWLKKLSGVGVIEKGIFPYDCDLKKVGNQEERTASASKDKEIETVRFVFPGEIYAKLMELGKSSDYVLHIYLAAGLVLLLNRYTGINDIIIGTPIYKQAVEGTLINRVVALRNQLEDNMTVKELLLQMRRTIAEAIENQNYPVEMLPGLLNLPGEGDKFPLFDTAILLETIHDKEYLKHIDNNMTFSFNGNDGSLDGNVQYNPGFYKRTTIERIVKHFIKLLNQAINNMDSSIACLEMVSGEERKQILCAIKNKKSVIPPDQAIRELSTEQLAGAVFLVLDRNLDLSPVNVQGELYIASPGLEGDCPGQNEPTPGKFVENPYASDLFGPGARNTLMYKTGALACRLPDGTIRFPGKRAGSVKIKEVDGYVAPGNEVEKKLVEVWAEVLKIEKEKIGINSNFFDLGGNSLKIVDMKSKLAKEFKIELPVAKLFEHSTISFLAHYLKEMEADKRIPGEVLQDREQPGKNGSQDQSFKEIAVIGMSLRFPGAKTKEVFWNNLKEGKETISFFSEEELLNAGLSPGLVNHPGYVKAASILEDKEFFDAHFFDYVPKEAELMDPQIRIFHEISWEALEDSGIDPDSYNGLIGVYAGAVQNLEWESRVLVSGKTSSFGSFITTRLTGIRFLCTRLSYNLNLKGPSVTVQTACSTSLVAIHMACRALTNGECDIALAGGIAVSAADRMGYLSQEGMIFSMDGHNRSFDAKGSGSIFGEGAGVVVLKPLEKARLNRDHIYAVIKGSAINNDGSRKVGFTAPSVSGQAEVIRAAHQAAGVEPRSISYVETHGTATSLGDPIEVEALGQAFNTGKKISCKIGSLKSNFGHLDTAAGVAGFIKTVLLLKNKMIPPTLHFETPNPEINFADTPFEVNTRLTELKRDAYPLRAGVSSMGIGGTNAHVILEEAVEREESSESRKYHIILLSTKSETSLDGAHKNLVDFLKNNNSINLADVAYTLQVGRKAFPSRRMAVCQDTPQAIAQLSSPGSSKVKTFHIKKEAGSVIFMFPGLGSHYVNMGLELYQTEGFFRREMDHCFDILKPILEVDVKEILYPQEKSTQTPGHKKNNHLHLSPGIHQNEIAQVAVFIFEYALARLLMHWGIEPQAMIGYSFGEYVAACIGGVFSIEEALKLVVSRGQLIGRLASGAMTSVPLGENQVKPLLNNELSLAVDNGESCIISGPKEAIAEFEKQVKENRGICMRLPNTHALHSHMMEPILTDFEEKVKQISLNKPKIPFISNVTGQWLTGEQAVDPGYWAMHLRHTIRFADGIKELVKKPKAIFVETGAGGDLSALLQRYINKDSGQKVVNLVRQASNEVSDVYYLFRQLGKLWLYGKKINWHNFYAREKRHIISLPTYPFEGRRFWIDKPSQARVMESISREFPSRNGTDHFDNFFTTFWKPSALVARSSEHIASRACRLVFMNEDSLSDRLTKRLETGGSEVFRIMTGIGFKKMDEYTYTLNPREINHYHRLMKELRAMGKIPSSIVHLWNVMEKEDQVSGFAWMDQVQDLGLNSLLFLAQAIKRLNPGDGDHSQLAITVVTNRMQKVPGQASGYPEKATLLGFVNIISKDNPHIKCRSIDIVSPAPGSWQEERLVEQLAAEIISIPAEPVIALRDRDRLVPALQPIPAELFNDTLKTMPGLKKEGVYLITGGLERPGLSFAQYLGRTMQAKLVLIKWTFPNLENRENQIEIIKLRQLEDLGAKVLVLSVDAAHPEQIREMVALAEEKFGQINGVIHTTGYYDESERITEISREMIDNVLTSLLKGTIALEHAFADAPLDFFAICSTSSSHPQTLNLLRNEAANSFLDLFASYRAPQKKFPITSVNWIQSQQVEDEIISKRIEDVFNIILNTSFSQVRVRLESIKKDKIQPQDESLEEKPPRTLINRPDLNSEYAAPRNKAEQLMVNMWEEILGVTPIGIHDNFFEMGVDSLRRFAFTNKLQELFGEIIHIAAIFDAPTVAELSDYFRKNYQEGYVKMMAEETVGKETGKAQEEVTKEKLEIVKSMLTPLSAPVEIEKAKNSSAVFILSPPRTGSTLLRVMLAGHTQLLAPPELNLLIHNTLSDRRTAMSDRWANHLQGAIHAIKQIKACSAREAEKMMADFENQGMTVKQFYHWMQECIARRKQVLVDKSPVYSLYPEAMKRAELYFQDPLYIFLVRHPYGMIRSFIEAKMDLLLGQDLIEKLSLSRQEIAEMTWTIRVQNILDFLKNVPANRQHWIKFEDLTGDPERTLLDICKFLNLEFNPEMLQPYKEKNKRMTEGLHSGGVMLGDMKFHRHKKIDRTVGDTWKSYYTKDFWGEPTRQLAKKFGYKSIRELQEENTVLEDKNPGMVEKKSAIFPLSIAQERLWFLNRLDDGSTSYNSPLGLKLKGPLDVDALSRSIDEIVRRHAVLRATFTTRDGKPVQVIGRSYHVPLLEKDFQHLGKDEQPESVRAVALKEVNRPFDLEKGPLTRACLLRLGYDHHVLLVIMHHIVTDGWSRGILFREISALYNAFSNGLPSPLPDLSIQYTDFALWQREQYETGELEPQRHYWKKQLGGAPQLLELPLDRPRPPVQTYRGTRTYFTVNNRLTKKLKRLSQETGATLYMILLAAFALLLSRLSGQDDMVIGSPIANRSWKQIESLIGFFVNTLVMRIHIPGNSTYKELLSHVRQITLDAYANQDLPFEKLVEELHPQRNLSYNPLFQVMFQVGNIPAGEIERTNLSISLLKLDVHTVKFDLLFEAAETKEGIRFECSYSTELFDRETIERYINYFKIIISTAAVNFNKRLWEIEIITNEEKKQVLYQFNDTAREYPGDKTIHKLFEEQVETSPDHMALIGPSVLSIQESPLQITYRELNEKSAQLAYVLRQRGVQPDTIVGIMAERSSEMILAILAILKAGGAYLPIDPGYPKDRIDYMLKDSGAKVSVTTGNMAQEGEKAERWEGKENLEIVLLDTLSSPILQNPVIPNFLTSHGDLQPATSLAYVIYTSGSTGRPKGVMVEHPNVIRLNKNTDFIRYQPDDRLLQTGALEFDASTFEIWGTLLNGLSLYLTHKENILNPGKLINLVTTNQITIMWLTSPLFNQLVQHDVSIFAGLRNLLVGGDALSPVHIEQARRRYPGMRIINGYGPTENTTFSTTFIIDREYKERIPIGKPIANSTAYIVDKINNLQAIGISGELLVGGEGVSRGYMNDPGLTAEKFVISHLPLVIKKLKRDVDRQSSLVIRSSKRLSKSTNDRSQKFPPNDRRPMINNRLYKTGDLARWQPDGNIEFLGRIDHQVKIRGFRVELGEIENRLLKHDRIKDTVVAVNEDESDDKSLTAYFVSDAVLAVTQLRDYLLKDLPDYMIPSYFVRLEEIPLTPNGKVDRKALPGPGLKVGESYTAPGNEIERKLVELWSEILGRDTLHASQLRTSIGIDDNFFQLGGHSLKATLLVSKIHKVFDVKVPLVEIFTMPRIKELAKYIKGKTKEFYISIEPAEEKEYYILSSAQKRLYILQQMMLDSTAYNMPEVILLTVLLPAEFDLGKIEETFKKLIKRHESLRTSFHMINDMPVQVIHDEVEFAIEYYNLTAEYTEYTGDNKDTKNKAGQAEVLGAALSQKGGLRAIVKSFIRQFDLSNAPMLRVGLLKTAAGDHLLLVDMHHIISDGVSQQVLVKDFLSLYAGEELQPLRVQYKDFSQWQNGEKEKENIKSQEEYWLREFAGEIPVLELPTDYPRPLAQSFAGNRIDFEIAAEETRALNAVALRQGATLFMVLMAINNILLSKLSGQEDIVIGTPIAGRRHADLEKIIGMFVNILLLRNYSAGHRIFGEFLEDVKERTLMAYENQEYQFEDLVDKLSVKRDIGRNPLFDIMFVLQNMNTGLPDQEKETGSETIPPVEADSPREYENIFQTAKFDITLGAVERDGVLFFSFQYCTKLFKKETIERFIVYFKKIVAIIVKEPGIKLSEIEIISAEEKNRILNDFNRTEAEYPKDKTIPQWFEAQVERTPDNIAVTGLPVLAIHETPLQITYKELNERSGQLAYELQTKNVSPDTIAGIMVERSVEMITGIMGILKSGGAYLPIAPGYPPDRIDYMVKDSGAKILLTQKEIVDLSSPKAPGIVPKGTPAHPRPSPASPTSLAYIIYTSGSTGRPKGVMVKHGNLANLVEGLNREIYRRYQQKLNICLVSPFIFDASIKQVFTALLSGHALNIVPERVRMDGTLLLRYLITYNIDISDGTPSHLRLLMGNMTKELLPVDVKHFIIGGETLTPDLAEGFFNKFGSKAPAIINIYGPTECTVDAAFFELRRENIHRFKMNIPIGKPMPNCRVYIVDKFARLQPIGIPGELLISGHGVGRGYLGKQELTSEKFVFDPFTKRKGVDNPMMYRTGDLARFLPDGNIEFLGRIDHQVKLRGYRIELAEIENRLLKAGGVKEAVVLLREELRNDKYICAYVVIDKEDEISGLRERLSKELPEYMIPSYFVQLEKIPLTANGKVDRRALPEPGLKAGEGYIGPGNELEKRLVALWAEVLGRNELHIAQLKTSIGIDDNFFELGGHSLKATILVSMIHKVCDVKIPLRKIFKMPKIRELAKYIKEKSKEYYISIEPGEEKEYYLLSSPQKRLYILHKMNLASTAYNMPEIIPLAAEFDCKKIEDTFKKLIKRHESLRASFHLVKDTPVQVVHDNVEFEVDIQDLKDSHEARNFIKRFIRPFDLSKAPLIRAGLIKEEGKGYSLIVDMHHIISDGVSRQILVKDFLSLYDGEELLPLRVQYKDFSQWQNQLVKTEAMKKQESYWLSEFDGKIPLLNMPIDYKRTGDMHFEGSYILFNIDESLTLKVKKLARRLDVTLMMFFFSLYGILLGAYAGQDEIIVGTITAGRPHADLQNIIGFFVNMLAIKTCPRKDKLFSDYLREVKEKILNAFENQEYQFEELVNKIDILRQPGRHPLVDVAFTYQGEAGGAANSGRNPLDAEELNFSSRKTSHSDLILHANETADSIRMRVEYSSHLFKASTIEELAAFYKDILTQAVENPDIKLKDIKIAVGLLTSSARIIQDDQDDWGI